MRLWKAVEGNFNCRRRKKIAGNLPAIFFWSESVSLEQPARSVVKPWPNGAEGHAQNKKKPDFDAKHFCQAFKVVSKNCNF